MTDDCQPSRTLGEGSPVEDDLSCSEVFSPRIDIAYAPLSCRWPLPAPLSDRVNGSTMALVPDDALHQSAPTKGDAEKVVAAAPATGGSAECENEVIARLLASVGTSSSDDVCRAMAAAIQELCSATACGILINEDGIVRWAVQDGAWPVEWRAVPPLSWLEQLTSSDQRQISLTDLARELDSYPTISPIAEVLITPIPSGADVGGTIWMVHEDAGRRFSSDQRRFALTCAQLARLALQAHPRETTAATGPADAFDSTAVLTPERRSFLLRLERELAALPTPDDAFRTACSLLAAELGARSIGYAEIDPAGTSLRVRCRWQHGVATIEPADTPLAELSELQRSAYQDGRPWLHASAESNGSSQLPQDSAAGAISVPLLRGARWAALLSVVPDSPCIWSREDVEFLRAAADCVSVATMTLQAAETLEASRDEAIRQRRLYEAILTNTPDLAYVFDLQHRFIYANEGLLAMWGKTWDDAIGRTCLELGYEPWHAAMHDREIDQVAATHRPIRGEVPFEGTFGRRIYDYIMVPVVGPDGLVEAVAGTTRDITNHKMAEDALRAGEERFRTLFTNIDEGFCLCEVVVDEATGDATDFRLLEFNPAFRAMLGLPFDAVGRTARELLPELKRHWIDQFARAALKRETVRFSDELASVGRQFEVFATAIAPEGRFATVLTDVTERMRGEALLLHHNAQFKVLLNSAPIGIYLLDADLRFREVNPIASAVFEQIPGGVIGRDFVEVIRTIWEQPFADEVIQTFRETLETGRPFVARERSERRRDRGVVEYYEWRLDRITLPNGSHGVVCYFRDVSDQVLTRIKISESEERFRSLVSVITDVHWTMDAEGRVLDHQPAWSNYTGQSWEQYREFGWIDAWHPDDRAAVWKAWVEARAKLAVFESTGRLWHAVSGQFRHCEARAKPRYGAGHVVREWVATCTDVHVRRRAEESLAEANRRKDEFLATIAHELRNPLAPIRNSIQILLMSSRGDETIDCLCQMMERQVNHIVRLVDDLLEVSRITRGAIELRIEETELEPIVRNAVDSCRPGIEAARHRLSLVLPPPPVRIRGDAVRLAQIISNLLNNAVKYTDAGGQIVLSAHVHQTDLVICVRDNGIGIPTEMQPRIFDMFMQVDSSMQRSQGGLGIGLTLVKRLVEMHGGSVTVESTGLGAGSAFTVRMPIVIPPSPMTRSLTGSTELEMTRRRILVVDDNQDAAASLAMLLKLLESDVAIANDGPTALATLETFQPEIVILDLGMPGMDGLEVARRIRRLPTGEGIFLVALTGWGQDADRERTRAAGFDHHLVKPAGIAELKNVLSAVEGR